MDIAMDIGSATIASCGDRLSWLTTGATVLRDEMLEPVEAKPGQTIPVGNRQMGDLPPLEAFPQRQEHRALEMQAAPDFRQPLVHGHACTQAVRFHRGNLTFQIVLPPRGWTPGSKPRSMTELVGLACREGRATASSPHRPPTPPRRPGRVPRPASCASSHYRFLVNTRGIEAALDQAHVQEPAEQQVVCEFLAEGPFAAHRVQGNQQRSLGSRSGGTKARPTLAYMRSNAGDRRARATSATALIHRRGWFFGIRSPGPQWPVSYVGRWVDIG